MYTPLCAFIPTGKRSVLYLAASWRVLAVAVASAYAMPAKLNTPPAPGGQTRQFVLSPNSTRAVYRADQDTDEVFELYSVPIGGGTVTKLHPSFVPGENVSFQKPVFRISLDNAQVVYRDNRSLYAAPLPGMRALFESPVANAIVAGVALIRGWAFDTVVDEPIALVQVFIHDVLDAEATCCSQRSDVQATFPGFPAANTLNSGWGNETAGMYTVRVDIVTPSGQMFSESQTVTGAFRSWISFSSVGRR